MCVCVRVAEGVWWCVFDCGVRVMLGVEVVVVEAVVVKEWVVVWAVVWAE